MAAPANNNFASAILLTGLTGAIAGVVLDDATTEGSEPSAQVTGGPHQTVWYKWVAPDHVDASVTFTYAATYAVGVYTGTTLAGLTRVARLDRSSTPSNTLTFSAVSGTTYYIQVGTTTGTEASGNSFSASYSSTTGSVRVAVAPFAGLFASTTDGTIQLDSVAGVSIQTINIKRGRPDEKEKTATGTATISGIDTAGAIDPTNFSATVKLDPTMPVTVSVRNPHTGVRKNLYVGYTADLDLDVDLSEQFFRFDLSAVDTLDFLADFEVIPGNAGTTAVPTASTGDVVYDAQNVDDRILAALADAAAAAGLAAWPAAQLDIFSGNVSVQNTVYAPRTSILQVIQDAADAEFPGVANFYVSKDGILTFHGRYARFHPDDVSYKINTWIVGDQSNYASFGGDFTIAVASGLTLTRGKTNLINAALATPTGILDADIAGQFSSDSSSIETYGPRSISFENLLTQGGLVSNIGDADAETKLFADYYKDNFAAPQNRLKQIVIRPQAGAAWDANNWDLLTRVEISDIITTFFSFHGGGGIFEDFYVEGITYDIDTTGGPTFPNLTLTLEVSPREFFDTDPFED